MAVYLFNIGKRGVPNAVMPTDCRNAAADLIAQTSVDDKMDLLFGNHTHQMIGKAADARQNQARILCRKVGENRLSASIPRPRIVCSAEDQYPVNRILLKKSVFDQHIQSVYKGGCLGAVAAVARVADCGARPAVVVYDFRICFGFEQLPPCF